MNIVEIFKTGGLPNGSPCPGPPWQSGLAVFTAQNSSQLSGFIEQNAPHSRQPEHFPGISTFSSSKP